MSGTNKLSYEQLLVLINETQKENAALIAELSYALLKIKQITEGKEDTVNHLKIKQIVDEQVQKLYSKSFCNDENLTDGPD
jgi:hypothetical protein